MARFTYSPAHKKNVTRETDPYLPRKTAPSASVCPDCHAICRNKRWYLDEQEAAAMARGKGGAFAERKCPACRKIADGFVAGLVTLRGAYFREHREEILNLIRNAERRAMGYNPLARIVRLTESVDGLEVWTTAEKLAQRIGREIHKACRGSVEYKWSEDSKLIRVNWARET